PAVKSPIRILCRVFKVISWFENNEASHEEILTTRRPGRNWVDRGIHLRTDLSRWTALGRIAVKFFMHPVSLAWRPDFRFRSVAIFWRWVARALLNQGRIESPN